MLVRVSRPRYTGHCSGLFFAPEGHRLKNRGKGDYMYIKKKEEVEAKNLARFLFVPAQCTCTVLQYKTIAHVQYLQREVQWTTSRCRDTHSGHYARHLFTGTSELHTKALRIHTPIVPRGM